MSRSVCLCRLNAIKRLSVSFERRQIDHKELEVSLGRVAFTSEWIIRNSFEILDLCYRRLLVTYLQVFKNNLVVIHIFNFFIVPHIKISQINSKSEQYTFIKILFLLQKVQSKKNHPSRYLSKTSGKNRFCPASLDRFETIFD